MEVLSSVYSKTTYFLNKLLPFFRSWGRIAHSTTLYTRERTDELNWGGVSNIQYVTTISRSVINLFAVLSELCNLKTCDTIYIISTESSTLLADQNKIPQKTSCMNCWIWSCPFSSSVLYLALSLYKLLLFLASPSILLVVYPDVFSFL